jgi:hypothetical protein
VICAALAATASAPARTGSAELRLISVQTRFATVDVKPDRRSAGDTETATSIVYNGLIPTAIGHGNMLCTVLDQATRSCAATYALPQGQIMTAGVIGSLRRYEVAIVGGTELYDKVRGSLSVTTTTLRPLRQRLSFHLLDVDLPPVVAPAALPSTPAVATATPPEPASSHGRGRKAGHVGKGHGRGHQDGG